jgi:hypothetical protein
VTYAVRLGASCSFNSSANVRRYDLSKAFGSAETVTARRPVYYYIPELRFSPSAFQIFEKLCKWNCPEVGSKQIVGSFSGFDFIFLAVNALHSGRLILRVIITLPQRTESETIFQMSKFLGDLLTVTSFLLLWVEAEISLLFRTGSKREEDALRLWQIPF